MTGFLDNRRILVLEDEFLVALDIQQVIEEYGGTVVGPIGRLEQAKSLAREETLDGAILDVNLNGSTSYELAQELLEAGVAVVFLTGNDASAVPEAFANVPLLSKPFDARLGERVLKNVFGAD